MNYLELVQDFMREAGMSGTVASVQGQVGEALRAVNWVAKAYRAIQTENPEWEFLRTDVTFNTNAVTVANPAGTIYTAAAAGIANLGQWRWRENDWRSYNAKLGPMDEQPLEFVPFEDFKRIYAYSANRLQVGRPVVITERPDQSLQFWPAPSDVYTIVGEMYQAPLALVNNTDVPAFAAKFHDVVVARALMLYGAFEGDGSVFSFGQSECQRVLAQMEEQYLPKWSASGPMA